MAHPQVPAGLAVTTAWAPHTHTAHTTQTPARGICPVAAEACPVSLKGQAPEGAGLWRQAYSSCQEGTSAWRSSHPVAMLSQGWKMGMFDRRF